MKGWQEAAELHSSLTSERGRESVEGEVCMDLCVCVFQLCGQGQYKKSGKVSCMDVCGLDHFCVSVQVEERTRDLLKGKRAQS